MDELPICAPIMKERLRAARKKADLSQDQVAEILGINQSSVAQWETGRSKPTPDRLPVLAKLYGVPEDWLAAPEGSEAPVLVQNKAERELLLLFRRLAADKQQTVLVMIRALITG